MDIQKFVGLFDGVRQTGDGYMARCPIHGDKHQSLSITEGDDGRILLNCFAGCAPEDIVAYKGYQMKDLFPVRQQHAQHRRQAAAVKPQPTNQQLDIYDDVPPPTDAPRDIYTDVPPPTDAPPVTRGNSEFRIPNSEFNHPVAIYNYTDENGELLYRKLRYLSGEGKRFEQQRPDGKGGFQHKLGDVRRVLYNLPAVVKADTVWVVEGEKDADTLCANGFVATTASEGAGSKWRGEYFETLRGKRVVIVPDNDEPGSKYAFAIANGLNGIAESVRIFDLGGGDEPVWPGMPEKADVTDFFEKWQREADQNGYAVAARLLINYAEMATEYRAAITPNGEKKYHLISMDSIAEEPVNWLWHPYIPLGKITILQGDPGLGKTFLAIRLAAAVSNGQPFPEASEPTPMGNVIFQTAEDGLADTIRGRLNDAGADCKKIFFLDESASSLTLDDERLHAAIMDERPKLVVIDPIQAYIGADKDMHRANEIRPIMARLGRIAAEAQCAVVLIGHLNKATAGKSIYRGMGSIDIAAAARSVLAVGEVPDMKYRRAAVQIKSSLAANGKTIMFDLDPTYGFSWAGTSELTAEEMLANTSRTERTAPAHNECGAFIKELLSNGPLPANKVLEAAKANGFAEITIKRAKKSLGIISRKDADQWVWALEDGHV